ncbi:hypothetical protein [Streptosporangium sp. KLBMP 9127]|nr:hypothetical protein [Streptosporangium sp. KLBMP 9127]
MSETTPNSKGPAPAQWTPTAPQPTLIPAADVTPEDIATLAIEYRDGQPVIVASGGQAIPARLKVVDASGSARALYGPVNWSSNEPITQMWYPSNDYFTSS